MGSMSIWPTMGCKCTAMCLDFTRASTLEVVGRDIVVLKLSEESLWRVEATERIATWGSGCEQPKRLNLLGFLAPSLQSFSIVLYLGKENMRSYLPRVPSSKIIARRIFPRASAGL